jgi:hypothetical protein
MGTSSNSDVPCAPDYGRVEAAWSMDFAQPDTGALRVLSFRPITV